MAKKLTEGTENEEFFNMSQEIEEFMKEKKGLIPNVDFYSATVYHTLGIDSDIFTLIFAMSRVAGWIAHIQEQQKNNKIDSSTLAVHRTRKYDLYSFRKTLGRKAIWQKKS